MKYAKTLSLAAMACAALMDFASTASATTLDTAGGVVKTGTTIEFSLAAETSMVFEVSTSPFEVQNKCTSSSMSGKTSNDTGTTVTGSISTLTFSGCTFEPMTTLKGGELDIEWTSGRNGTVSSSGTEVETKTFAGICIYGTSEGTKLGTFDGVAKTTEKAKLTISAELPLIKIVSGSCSNPTRLTATYQVTSPTGLTVTN